MLAAQRGTSWCLQIHGSHPGFLQKIFSLWLNPHKHCHSRSPRPDCRCLVAVDFKYNPSQEISSGILSFGKRRWGSLSVGREGGNKRSQRISVLYRLSSDGVLRASSALCSPLQQEERSAVLDGTSPVFRRHCWDVTFP